MRPKPRTICFVCLLFLLCLGLVEEWASRANATLTASSWIEEVNLPSDIGEPTYVYVDVDSQGRVYVFSSANGTTWRSDDRGVSWTKIHDGKAGYSGSGFYVDSRDYVYVLFTATGIGPLYRSTDYGGTWTQISDTGGHPNILNRWREDSQGRIYFSNYEIGSAVKSYIWRSDANGSSFQVWANLTATGPGLGMGRHVHDFTILDDAPYTDWVYVSTGDSHRDNFTASIRRWNTVSWTVIVNNTWIDNITAPVWRYCQPTALAVYDGWMHFYPDEWDNIIRMPINGTWAQREPVVHDSYAISAGSGLFYDATKVDDIVFATDAQHNFWGTWDGMHYVKLQYFGTAEVRYCNSHRDHFPYYYVSRIGTPRLYRISRMNPEDLVQLFYSQYNNERGRVANNESYVLEQRLHNGTNYLDLTKVALSGVQATIKGLTRREQLLTNPGFETGTTAGWTIAAGASNLSVTNTVAAEGTWSLMANVTKTTTSPIIEQSFGTVAPNEAIFIGFQYMNNKQFNSSAFIVYIYNGSTAVTVKGFTSRKEWYQNYIIYGTHGVASSWTGKVRFLFQGSQAPLVTYIDAVIVRIPETAYIKKHNDDTDETVAYGPWNATYAPTVVTRDTLNPSINVSGQLVTHAGSLANGTGSAATSLSGILTGAVRADANIGGSGQAILRLEGTRTFNTAKVILKGYMNGWYYGRYYSELTLLAQPSVFTNLQADITSLSAASNKLTLTIKSPSGTTSTTKVYCGDGGGAFANAGEPTQVRTTSGTLTWSYNASTDILTISIIHSGPANVLVDWRMPGDINGDWKVNFHDLFNMKQAFGSTSSEPIWNSNCDLDWNGKVDVSDLCKVGKNYGTSANVNGDSKADNYYLLQLGEACGSALHSRTEIRTVTSSRTGIAIPDPDCLGKNCRKKGLSQ